MKQSQENGKGKSSTLSGIGNGILTMKPLPASRKMYLEGKQKGVRVAMREIQLSSTKIGETGTVEENSPLLVYDPSGPYTDPEATIDIHKGLSPLRANWIQNREDVDDLSKISLEYGRLRASDPKLEDIRFKQTKPPLRAKSGRNVTQIHFNLRGAK